MDKCKRHNRYSCYDSQCRRDRERSQDNNGSIGINTDGNLSIGLGGGLTIDPSDGSVGFGGSNSGFGGFDT